MSFIKLFTVRTAIVVAILLLIFLMLFQSIWVFGGSSTGIMNQAGLQRTRLQAIVKDVLIMAYRPAIERPEAIGELQIILPAWEKTQKGLKEGDATLQLPTHVPDAIEQAVIAAGPDYIAIDVAARTILAHTQSPVDPVQIAIIQAHADNYSLAMTQVVDAWQMQIDGAFLHIYWIEIALAAIIAALLVFVLASK